MTEQRPRMQSRPMVLPLRQGDAAVIAVHHRPVQGTRGAYRVNLRHGVSRDQIMNVWYDVDLALLRCLRFTPFEATDQTPGRDSAGADQVPRSDLAYQCAAHPTTGHDPECAR